MSEKHYWVLEEATYQVTDGKPEIILFGRSYEDKFKTAVHVVKGFKPYFYAPAHERHYDHLITHYGPDVEIDALGREVRKCYTRIPKDVKAVRDKFEFTDMADFLFEKRYLVDAGIKYAYEWDAKRGIATPVDVPSILMPRIVYFDIEVLAPESILPLPFNPDYPVVSIQVMDSYTKKIVVFTNGLPCQCAEDHMECGSEAKLFKAFQSYLKVIDPDIISGWNISAYDVPYLIKRAQLIGVSISGLGRWGKPYAEFTTRDNKSAWSIKVKGRSTLDMIDAYKKLMIMKGQKESYALKEISKEYGFEYIDYGAKLQRLFDNGDWDTFLQYCRNDVISLENIDNHPDVILFEFYEYIRMICGTRIDDTLYNSKLIEMYLLHHGIKPMPTKRYGGEPKKKYEGAYVMSPPPGVHQQVGMVDLAALYPTIMRAYPNETCPDIDLKIIEMINTFVDEREALRELRKSGDDSSGTAVREYAYKVLANSVYGVVGSPNFRLFKRECAEFVTSTGRNIIHYIHEQLTDKYMKTVIYGDSVTGDSIVEVYDDEFDLRAVKIEDLFTKVDYKNGDKEYCNLENVFTDSIDDNKRVITERVMYIMRHLTDKQLYMVILASGNSIVVTEDHSIYVYRPNKGIVETVESKKLKGKYVIYKYGSGAIQISKVVNLKKLGRTTNYVYDLSNETHHRYFANNILVSNTDSSAFNSISNPKEGLEIQDSLNQDLLSWSNEHNAKVPFSLKFEKLYRTLLFKKGSTGKDVAKKKYCGHLLWEEGVVKNELNFKGLELKRSDQSRVTKTCLYKFLDLVLMEVKVPEAINYVHEIYKKSLAGDLHYRDASIPKMIRSVGNKSPHARGIENTKTYYHYNIPDGVKPRLLYLKGSVKEICIDDEFELDPVTVENIDWEQMTESNITKKMKSYIESLGYKWDVVIHGQTSLDRFR